jgi:DNA-directed RNA polymerase II subunit RPB1
MAPRRGLPLRRDPDHTIASVSFGFFEAAEIQRMAACKITEHACFVNGAPAPNGPMDLRMGTTCQALRCATCSETLEACPGHFGYVQLAFPCFHPCLLDTTLKMLRCVCFFCSAFLLDEEARRDLRLAGDRRARLSELVAATRSRRVCHRCGGHSPVFSRGGLTIRADFSRATFTDEEERAYCSRCFTAAEARLVLKGVDEETLRLMGLDPAKSRADALILTSLLILPPAARPGCGGDRHTAPDDITARIVDIVKANNHLRAALEREAARLPEMGLSAVAQTALLALTQAIAALMLGENRSAGGFHRTGPPSRSIASSLKGKDGRIRGSMMGKRVDFSARSVISPDGEHDVNELGVPRHVAMSLFVPEPFADLSAQRLRERVLAGPRSLEGAYSVDRGDGSRLLLDFCDLERLAASLEPGDVVNRYIQNGDVLIFNRQPSFQRHSMMAFRAVIVDGNTFRANLSTSGAYNLDFDGDEMNVHAPQDWEALVEASTLLDVSRHIVSPQANKPCVAVVQDGLIAAYLLTSPSTRLERWQMLELRSVLRYPRGELPPPEADGRWPGRRAFELLLWPDLVYRNSRVSVRRGLLSETSRVCRMTIGTASGSLVHHAWLHYGPEEANRFLSDCQRLLNRYLSWRGFSVRLSDCEPSPRMLDLSRQIVELGARRVAAVEADEALVRLIPEKTEFACAELANRILTEVGKVVHAELDEATNALCQSVASGSKGNLVNISQLMTVVGQQSITGRRPRGASLPMSDDAPWHVLERNGFVATGYYTGLSPAAFLFHAMAGREGLIDTAVKTGTTGYAQRRLAKAMETLVVQYDLTVRDSRGCVVQFAYGCDSFDATYLVRQGTPYLHSTPERLAEELAPEELPDFLAALARQACRGAEAPECIYTPCRVEQHLLAVAPARIGQAPIARELVDEAVARIVRRRGHFDDHGLLALHLAWHLRRGVCETLDARGLASALDALLRDGERSVVSPGEVVGLVAAQGLGERFSQQCLSNFHFAGVENTTVTRGVARIKELIDCTRTKTPITTVALDMPPERAGDLLERLRQFTLRRATEEVILVEDPDHFSSRLGGEDDRICGIARLLLAAGADLPETRSPLSSTVARLSLSRASLRARKISAGDVGVLVAQRLPSWQVLWSESEAEPFLRLRPPAGLADVEEQVAKMQREVTICGVPGVTDAQLRDTPEGGLELEAFGGDLLALLGIPEARAETALCNDVEAVCATLGIEAATAALSREMRATLSTDYICERHIRLLCCLMTHLGHLLPISRHGLNRKTNSGPLSKCSFEEAIDQLFEAALYSERDPVVDVTSRVMVGRRADVGTGLCHVLPAREDVPAADAEEDEEGDEEIVLATGDDTADIRPPRLLAPPVVAEAVAGTAAEGAPRKRYRPSSPTAR